MSATNTQFSIAVHLLAGLGALPSRQATSAELSGSVNACPSFVRRVLSKLSKAELIRTTMGKSGSCALAKNPEKISLLEIYEAVGSPKPFTIHDYPIRKSCAVSCGIKSSMEVVLDKTTKAMEVSLKATTLAEVISGLGNKK